MTTNNGTVAAKVLFGGTTGPDLAIAAVQFNPTVGALEENTRRMFDFYQEAVGNGAELVVFPEMAVTGYPIEDLALVPSFVEAAQAAGRAFVKKVQDSKLDAAVIFGNLHESSKSVKPTNSAWAFDPVVMDQKYTHVDKYELPNYGVFDEVRIFEPSKESALRTIFIRGISVGILICEDTWHDTVPAALGINGCDLAISINGSPFEIDKQKVRYDVVRSACATLDCPLLYLNTVGGQDELVFDGASFYYDLTTIRQFPAFVEDIYYIPFHFKVSSDQAEDYQPILSYVGCQASASIHEEIYRACVLGLRDYLRKQRFDSVVLGMSGGVDSGLVAALAVDALGADKVNLVRLPSKYSSKGSLSDAAAAAERLGAKMRTVDIEPVVEALRTVYRTADYPSQFDEPPARAMTADDRKYAVKHEMPFLTDKYKAEFLRGEHDDDPRNAAFMRKRSKELVGVADENIQARARGNILMAISNQEGHMLLTTGNKSEVSVGYCVDGTTLISTDQGSFRANDLSANYRGKTIHGNAITDTFIAVKSERVVIRTQVGTKLICGIDHPVKVHDPKTGNNTFVNAGELTGNEVLIGSNYFCDRSEPVKIDFDFIRKKYDFRSPMDIILPHVVDNHTATMLGVCVADGSFTTGSYVITTGKSEVIAFVTKWLIDCNISHNVVDAGNGVSRVICNSVEFMQWLGYCGVKHLSENKVVPWVIMQSPVEIVRSFLCGILLDSSLNSKKNTTELVFNSKNPALAEEIQFLMGEIGVRSYLRPTQHGRTSTYIPSSEQDGLSLLKEKNQVVVDRQDANRIKPRAGLDYIYFTDSELDEILCSIPWQNRITVRRGYKKNRLSRAWVKNAVKNGILNHSYLKNESRFITINDIDVEAGDFVMFDFSVDNIEQFEANGLTVHNCTLYGDMSGGYNPIKDCYKTTVWEMCRFRNALNGEQIDRFGFLGPANTEVVPEEIISKPPSAELRPDQKDEDSLPPYPVLDGILRMMVEEAQSNLAIESKGYDVKDILRVRKLLDMAEYKRRQAAPGVKITSKIHGRDRRVPIVNHFDSGQAMKMKLTAPESEQ